jgi:hypothetical protein
MIKTPNVSKREIMGGGLVAAFCPQLVFLCAALKKTVKNFVVYVSQCRFTWFIPFLGANLVKKKSYNFWQWISWLTHR